MLHKFYVLYSEWSILFVHCQSKVRMTHEWNQLLSIIIKRGHVYKASNENNWKRVYGTKEERRGPSLSHICLNRIFSSLPPAATTTLPPMSPLSSWGRYFSLPYTLPLSFHWPASLSTIKLVVLHLHHINWQLCHYRVINNDWWCWSGKWEEATCNRLKQWNKATVKEGGNGEEVQLQINARATKWMWKRRH